MPANLFDVQDKIVVVTGGLGQLGRQFTQALLERGAKVAVFDLNIQRSTLTPHDNLRLVEANVTRRDSIEAALRDVARVWGVPHALVNNAALDAPPNAPAEENGPFETYPESSWDKVMDVNVKGVFLCCQIVGGAMAEAGRGSIVNISSIYGLVSPNQNIYEYRRASGQQFYKPVAYSVSKSALFNLTRYLATYWAGRGVRVNTLTFAGVFNNQPQEFLTAYLPHVPLGRMAHEDEYNGAVIFLVSDASSYMTGANMIIDGGWTAW
jgi:NAD(P)-dependent dehydrogenase (short-subunit alcohol dehydrogenase family)